MGAKIIGLIAAMPEEIRPLLRLAGKYTKEKIDGLDAYRFTYGKEMILLVNSGMGLENAAAATKILINKAKPCLIVNFGFCGAVKPGPQVGDIMVAQRILLNGDTLFSPQSGIVEEEAKRLSRSLASSLNGKDFRVYGGAFITAAGIKSKAEMVRLIPAWAPNPVLEMETAAVAKTAAEGGVPLMAVRGVSDDAGEEFGFSISELTDNKLRIRFWKVFLTVARKPWIIPQMLRLTKNSRKAGKNLALAIATLLEDTDDLPLKRDRHD
ncbi:MAG TPA: nucleoside phosphorylase [Geobacteraceae bacterium]|nr:nucleoside phosphorylase [Geobacteraceae bacterium]